MPRSYKRAHDQLRPLHMTTELSGNADGSVLFEIGNTKVLCAVSLAPSVPLFMRNKNKWWLTASYALLPSSTQVRTERESMGKRNERSVEISRLIGRCLRSIVNLNDIPTERTIHVDCDVIQADGGTRTACINGAFAALSLAEQKWLKKGLIEKPIIQQELAAVSVGIIKGISMLDIDFVEDSNGDADFNFVMNRRGDIIELQGCGEKEPIGWDRVQAMKELAHKGVKEILIFIDEKLDFQKNNRPKFTLKDIVQSSL